MKEEDITIVNIYAPNIRASQYIMQILTAIKGEIDSNTVIVGDFNTQLTTMDRLSRQKVSKEAQTLNDTLDQMDLTYRAFHPKAAEYTFISHAHGTFSRIDHMLGHKASLGKFKKIEIISGNFSDHNAIRLEINYKKKNVKITSTWRLNNMLLNNNVSLKKSKRKSKSTWRQMKMKVQQSKAFGMQQKQF